MPDDAGADGGAHSFPSDSPHGKDAHDEAARVAGARVDDDGFGLAGFAGVADVEAAARDGDLWASILAS